MKKPIRGRGGRKSFPCEGTYKAKNKRLSGEIIARSVMLDSGGRWKSVSVDREELAGNSDGDGDNPDSWPDIRGYTGEDLFRHVSRNPAVYNGNDIRRRIGTVDIVGWIVDFPQVAEIRIAVRGCGIYRRDIDSLCNLVLDNWNRRDCGWVGQFVFFSRLATPQFSGVIRRGDSGRRNDGLVAAQSGG